nr:unnamed protein product [Callosobruchus analis]
MQNLLQYGQHVKKQHLSELRILECHVLFCICGVQGGYIPLENLALSKYFMHHSRLASMTNPTTIFSFHHCLPNIPVTSERGAEREPAESMEKICCQGGVAQYSDLVV